MWSFSVPTSPVSLLKQSLFWKSHKGNETINVHLTFNFFYTVQWKLIHLFSKYQQPSQGSIPQNNFSWMRGKNLYDVNWRVLRYAKLYMCPVLGSGSVYIKVIWNSNYLELKSPCKNFSKENKMSFHLLRKTLSPKSWNQLGQSLPNSFWRWSFLFQSPHWSV